jgi:hypothetical protein
MLPYQDGLVFWRCRPRPNLGSCEIPEAALAAGNSIKTKPAAAGSTWRLREGS